MLLFILIVVFALLLLGLLGAASKRPRRRDGGPGWVAMSDETEDDNPTGLGPGYTRQDVGAHEAEQDSLKPGGGDFGGGGASGDWGDSDSGDSGNGGD